MCSSPAPRSCSCSTTPSPPSARPPTARIRRYGEDRRTVGELLAALDRSNFRVESFDELGVSGESAVPTTLAIKVRKQGS